MILLAEKKLCTGCGVCAQVCTQKCISMNPDKEGFLYPEIDSTSCLKCRKCLSVCPVLKPDKNPDNNLTAYAFSNNNEEIRLSSSSGGFFSLLAGYVLESDGVVFGAALDDRLSVRHISVTDIKDLYKIRGSKYVQSSNESSYSEAKSFLESGRLVLYTGTPCQIEGLIAYLGKKYDNLITQDIICHGVPSPLVWEKYLDWQKVIEKSNIVNAAFRDKTSGWKRFSMMLEFENGKKEAYNLKSDLFLRSFLADLCLRPSCYNCKFKNKVHAADFTLADFWNVHKVIEGFNDDDKGISLILINDKKSESILDQVKKDHFCIQVNPDEALKYNSAATSSVAMPPTRQTFMEEIIISDFQKVVEKYAPEKKPDGILTKLVKKAKKLIH